MNYYVDAFTQMQCHQMVLNFLCEQCSIMTVYVLVLPSLKSLVPLQPPFILYACLVPNYYI